MPGGKNILMGVGFLILGLVITGVTYALAPGGYYVVAYGAVVVGGIQLVIGLGQAAIYKLRTPEGRAKHHARIGMRVILRSMISMSAADGILEEGEIVVIQMIARAVFGWPVEEQLIREIYDKMLDDGGDISEELSDLRSQVTAEDADLAIKAITMVALADGAASDEERQRLTDYANALQVYGERLNVCIDEARQTIDRIIDAQNEDQRETGEPAYA